MTRLLTVRQTLALVPISKSAMYAGIKEGEIPAVQVAGRWLIPETWIEGLLTSAHEEVAAS